MSNPRYADDLPPQLKKDHIAKLRTATIVGKLVGTQFVSLVDPPVLRGWTW
jgi:hypothetical protein